MKNRRRFLRDSALSGAVLGLHGAGWASAQNTPEPAPRERGSDLKADVVVCGGGLGGLACTLALLDRGFSVILVEEFPWLGGQLTSQGVPPDENRWIESFGATRRYAALRNRIRRSVQSEPGLKKRFRTSQNLNPGNGSVSRLCVEPRIAAAVIHQWIYSRPRLQVLLEHVPVRMDHQDGTIRSLVVRHRFDRDQEYTLHARWFVDATELGDLLPLSDTDWVTGNEGRAITGELHAPEGTDPENQQAFTLCFALQFNPHRTETGPEPANYNEWRNFVPDLNPPWPGRLFDLTYTHPRSLEPRLLGFNPRDPAKYTGVVNLWTYRRIVDHNLHQSPRYPGDVSLVNWPQNDYLKSNLIGTDDERRQAILEDARQMNLCLLHWLRTEVPRPDGGHGWPGLELCPGAMGTPDGMAMAPYIRESRRIRALYTITEADCGIEQRRLEKAANPSPDRSRLYHDSIGIGHYPIDLHPTTTGDNYIDFPTWPFQIPLGALIPQKTTNLIAANKNIGTTHLTNGCYRLHPVEWNIGESAGNLIAYCQTNGLTPKAVHGSMAHVAALRDQLHEDGIRTTWPDEVFAQ